MSEHYLTFIPVNPEFVPASDLCAMAKEVFTHLLGGASEIEIVVTEEIAFVDQGENFEKIQCPRCGAELSTPWWQGAMSRSFESKFRQMDITTPCCRCATTLNDLIYIFPAGFARFQLRARGPKKPQLTPQEQSQLEQILRTPLKQIWVHY